MSDADGQIIRLLTEMRDAQQEEIVYRRKVLDESLTLTRRAVRMQRIGLAIVVVFIILSVVLIVGR